MNRDEAVAVALLADSMVLLADLQHVESDYEAAERSIDNADQLLMAASAGIGTDRVADNVHMGFVLLETVEWSSVCYLCIFEVLQNAVEAVLHFAQACLSMRESHSLLAA
jgi:hypothetical protein